MDGSLIQSYKKIININIPQSSSDTFMDFWLDMGRILKACVTVPELVGSPLAGLNSLPADGFGAAS